MGPVRRGDSWLGLLLLTTTAALLRPVRANAEKVIFAGPAPVSIPLAESSLPDLNLISVLGADTSWSIRTNLSRVFHQEGLPAWLLLDSLTEGQRYELRVCWSALEPTSFTLDVYPLHMVRETPELIQSLADYASSRQTDPAAADKRSSSQYDMGERRASVLLLSIRAEADYFSHDTSLMKHPPPVLVDLILDPYLYNVVPRSLLPTAGYLTAVAIAAWFVAQRCAGSLVSIAGSGDDGQTKKQN